MRQLVCLLFAAVLAASASTALAQASHEIKGKVLQVDAATKHLVVEESHGRKYKQPLSVGKDSKVELDQVHVGDEVVVHFHPGPTGPELIDLQVTKAAGT